MKRTRFGVLVSGSGTNLQSILDAVKDQTLQGDVAVVISNVATAQGLERARNAGVPALALDHKNFGSRGQFDEALVAALRAHNVDVVVLAGFMRLVTPVLLDAFPQRVINIHPALLPAFPGVDGQGQAFRYGVRIAGCTVHFVDAGTDTGPIIAQAAVPVHDDDTEASLRARILREEHKLLPKVLQWVVEGRLRLEPAPSGASAAVPRMVVRVLGAQGAFLAPETPEGAGAA